MLRLRLTASPAGTPAWGHRAVVAEGCDDALPRVYQIGGRHRSSLLSPFVSIPRSHMRLPVVLAVATHLSVINAFAQSATFARTDYPFLGPAERSRPPTST